MKKIKCLIVDDEPLAVTVLENYLGKLEEISCNSCDNGISALQVLQSTPYDLVFLDIEMPVFSGLELIKTLKNPPAIIITTAFTDFAVQGFEYEVLDYLVKPFSFPRFMKAVERFLRISTGEMSTQLQQEQKDTFMFLKTEKKYIRLKIGDILYIESLKDYIKVHTTTASFLSYQTLSSFTGHLPHNQFIRIHRSYTIALDKVQGFNQDEIEIGKATLPVSREKRKEVFERLVSCSF